MADPKNILNDVAKMASGAMGSLVGARGEIDEMIRHRLDRLVSRLDLVAREDFDAVKAMAQKARTENEALKARLDALEAQLAPAPAATKKPAAKKAAPRKAPLRKAPAKAAK